MTGKKRSCLLLDIEADSLSPTVVWVVVCKSLLTGAMVTFNDPHHEVDKIRELIEGHDKVCAHFGISYDFRVLDELLGIHIPFEKLIDTVVVSKLLNSKREGGHSLSAWGERLGYPKSDFNDFSKWSEEMAEYCRRDVLVLERVFESLYKLIDRNPGVFDEAVATEHHAQYVAQLMHRNGFRFDIDEAKKIYKEIEDQLQPLMEKITETFPPKVEHIRMKTKTKVVTTSFNPGSPKQVVERMWELGWKPTVKTKSHLDAEKSRDKERIAKFKVTGWKINEDNLATLPSDAPEGAKLLVKYTLLSARLRTLTEWMNAYNPEMGRIHGEFDPLGTSTHRMSHSKPNMGNIATKKTIKYNTPELRELAVHYGGRMRALWICADDAWLVGTDMEGAHLRIFAHLINDKDFTEALVTGKKEDGTDPHSKNKRILGTICVDRDRAKTFIFSYLNGASAPKVSEIFGCSGKAAKEALDTFVRAYPGLAFLKSNAIPDAASKGYFVGVDGRYVLCDSEHLMMGMLLQNAEATLMKRANKMWMQILDHMGVHYKQVNFVHDEWVTEVYGTKDLAKKVARIQSYCIHRVGKMYKLNCPLGGESKIGKNWLEVH